LHYSQVPKSFEDNDLSLHIIIGKSSGPYIHYLSEDIQAELSQIGSRIPHDSDFKRSLPL
jgi:hypothetical protein